MAMTPRTEDAPRAVKFWRVLAERRSRLENDPGHFCGILYRRKMTGICKRDQARARNKLLRPLPFVLM